MYGETFNSQVYRPGMQAWQNEKGASWQEAPTKITLYQKGNGIHRILALQALPSAQNEALPS
ncbi:hypothetical protein J22TS3_05560 [Paenibacillus sp. J22TS3]|nr:hypothetical protein J22TS3_05560 [Paenibacillus sp. J22TS3]